MPWSTDAEAFDAAEVCASNWFRSEFNSASDVPLLNELPPDWEVVDVAADGCTCAEEDGCVPGALGDPLPDKKYHAPKSTTTMTTIHTIAFIDIRY